MVTWVCKELLHAAQWFCSQTECPATELLSETSCCQLSLPAYIDICPGKGWPNLVAFSRKSCYLTERRCNKGMMALVIWAGCLGFEQKEFSYFLPHRRNMLGAKLTRQCRKAARYGTARNWLKNLKHEHVLPSITISQQLPVSTLSFLQPRRQVPLLDFGHRSSSN